MQKTTLSILLGILCPLFSISTMGEGSMILETKNLVAGTYIYTLTMDGKEAISKKMIVAAE